MYSQLASEFVPAAVNNYYGTRTNSIDKIIVHHMAGVATAKQCAIGFQNPERGAASNYCIGKDGDIVCCVDEFFASGASSNKDADMSGITIEVSNSIYGDLFGWPISDKSYKALVNLLADIANRYKLYPLVPGKNLCWHKMYAATACPGPYILKRIDKIASEANALISNKEYRQGYITETNKNRKTDWLVKFTPEFGSTTKQNKYGTEVICDSNGVVVAIEKNKGNAKIGDGFVLSGHGKAKNFLDTSLKVGYRVKISEAGKLSIDTHQHRSLNGLDILRRTNYLVFYTTGYTANTNKYGVEARIKSYQAVDIEIGKGKMKLDGGWILSGHGESAEWIKKNIKKGTRVVRDEDVVIIK